MGSGFWISGLQRCCSFAFWGLVQGFGWSGLGFRDLGLQGSGCRLLASFVGFGSRALGSPRDLGVGFWGLRSKCRVLQGLGIRKG